MTAAGLEFEVRYCDMNGEQLSRTQAKMAYDTSRGWDHGEVHLYKAEETTPYATRASSVTIAPPADT